MDEFEFKYTRLNCGKYLLVLNRGNALLLFKLLDDLVRKVGGKIELVDPLCWNCNEDHIKLLQAMPEVKLTYCSKMKIMS